MITVISLVTSVKDYFEVVHKLIEYDSVNINYAELGSLITYFIISLKNSLVDFLSFSWLLKENILSLPIIIPEISSAMISEISVLDGYFHNAFNFLDTPISYGISSSITSGVGQAQSVLSSNEQNGFIALIEKFIIGGINSFFLFLPTSTAHIITLRRFVMQGLEAGYISGLGTIAGNIFWLGSVILGFRFFVIPWLSLDIFRYLLGFILLVKYMWDSYNEKKIVSNTENSFGSEQTKATVLETKSTNIKIFVLNFLLALTEQTSIYPFISNISMNPEGSIIENLSLTGIQLGTDGSNGLFLIGLHLTYLLGITVGSLSLLHLSCWFWENPAFKLYMWVISSFKVPTTVYYKTLNFTFLYLTMLSAVCSIPYYGLDYTVTNPLGYVNDDRLIQDKVILETSFLGTKASDRNTRRNRGRHGRRERWKRRIRKYRTFDASLYDQGIYDLFTIEDLNYGFDRFWLRRKLRNHRVRFRFFPGPWMRSFKKQLAKPRLESYTGPRIEFFRILYEQVYHPSFHGYQTKSDLKTNKQDISYMKGETKGKQNTIQTPSSIFLQKKTKLTNSNPSDFASATADGGRLQMKRSLLRKFIRKFDTRIKASKLRSESQNLNLNLRPLTNVKTKAEKAAFLVPPAAKTVNSLTFYQNSPLVIDNNKKQQQKVSTLDILDENQQKINFPVSKVGVSDLLLGSKFSSRTYGREGTGSEGLTNTLKTNSYISKKDFQILQYRTLLKQSNSNNNVNIISNNLDKSVMLLHPLKFYLQQEASFKRKLHYYTPNVYRKFSVENNAPYYRVMMKRYFYNYKPTLRWERTMKVASLRKARRKITRIPRKLQKTDLSLNNQNQVIPVLPNVTDKNTNVMNSYPPLLFEKASLQKSSNNYSVVSKRASRYRYQIYKDVLQHWYYSPFNRILLKFDVDNFIKRQPNAHFLTTTEEKLLHLRRFLLFEHYNTLRWYTNMEHYRSMKTQLNGGTKSFSSRPYNQQFFGTFKKIRHLFAITPSISTVSTLSKVDQENKNTNILSSKVSPQKEDKDQINVLQFDQLLYNEFPNDKNNFVGKNGTNVNPLIIHEEILPDYTNENLSKLNGDLLSQSQDIVRNYLIETRSIREEYIKQLLNNNDYSTLTQFIYKGQKTRGNEPATNQTILNNQEKDYLLTSTEKNQIENELKNIINKEQIKNNPNSNLSGSLNEQLYLIYLKNWKRRVNDQESLKNFLTRRLDKREKRKQKKQKQIFAKLKRLETWYSFDKDDANLNSVNKSVKNKNSTLDNDASVTSDLLTSGLQKSILEGMYVLNNVNKDVDSLTQKNLSKVLLLSKIKDKTYLENINQMGETSKQALSSSLNSFTNLQDLTLRINDLERVQKSKLSSDIQTNVQSIRKILKSTDFDNDSKKTLIYSLRTKLNNYRKICLRNINTAKDTFLGFTQFTFNKINIFKTAKRKSLLDWRRKERALGKQKRSRKEFKLLNKKNEFLSTYLDSNELEYDLQSSSRKKRDTNVDTNQVEIQSSSPKYTYSTNSFKRKRSPQRRSRTRRNRGVFKKRTLTDILRKDLIQFNSIKDTSSVGLAEKQKYINKLSYELYGTSVTNAPSTDNTPLKQRKSKQRKERYWKQKRSKYSQKRRKYRKRRRYATVKIRNLNKQFKRIQNKLAIQNWWWKQFIPSIQASNEALWQIERDKLIQQKLSQLSISNILERESLNNESFNSLQIGNKDFKPLALPETMAQFQSNQFKLNNRSTSFDNQYKNEDFSLLQETKEKQNNFVNTNNTNSNLNIVNKLYESLFIDETKNNDSFNQFLLPNTNLPFYAGWDESLRKFIVTNRMLSRKDAGFTLTSYQNESQITGSSSLQSSGLRNKEGKESQINQNDYLSEYSLAPLQGMNAATTLYWQIPFTTYDPDQFFALGMDGFSPIGWRKFLFRHSILKNWLDSRFNSQNNSLNDKQIFDKSSDLIGISANNKQATLIVKNRSNILSDLSLVTNSFVDQTKQHKTSFASSRRLKKRYRRVKKHPRTPVWFPSGPLSNQVLPVHYIYVFYKRSRLPRDRYLKRRLLNVKNQNTTFINNFIEENSQVNNYDFTLRKRLKPKRKYHLKRDYYVSNVVIPRRLKFMSNVGVSNKQGINQSISDIQTWRPLSALKIHKPIGEVVKEQQILRRSAMQKQRSSKQQPNMRVKQLRRRIQRQVIRTVWRYRPRAGGFVWPGDYLKLELVKAPKLQIVDKNVGNSLKVKDTHKISSQNSTLEKLSVGRKQKRKKKRNLVEWQIQPKKYLYEKHNLKVIRKKLIKAQRSNSKHSNLKHSNYSTTLNILRNSI